MISGVVLALDYVTGPYILFPVFFVVPILLLAWNTTLGRAVLFALALCLVRFSFRLFWDSPSSMPVAGLNLTMAFGVLCLIAALTHRTAHQTRALRQEIRTLEGLLRICSFCKSIQDERGEWMQLERYVSGHSETQFSHGVCPTCFKIHYGDLVKITGAS